MGKRTRRESWKMDRQRMMVEFLERAEKRVATNELRKRISTHEKTSDRMEIPQSKLTKRRAGSLLKNRTWFQ